MAKRPEYLIRKRSQLNATASPVRHMILEAMDLTGPCSVKELANRLGREPDSLYYHIRELTRVGLMINVDKRIVNRRTEIIYDVVGRPFRIDPTETGKAFLTAIGKAASARLRLAQRSLVRTILDPESVREGAARSWRCEQISARLTLRDQKKLNKMIDEAVCFLRDHDDAEKGEAVTVTLTSSRSPHSMEDDEQQA